MYKNNNLCIPTKAIKVKQSSNLGEQCVSVISAAGIPDTWPIGNQGKGRTRTMKGKDADVQG